MTTNTKDVAASNTVASRKLANCVDRSGLVIDSTMNKSTATDQRTRNCNGQKTAKLKAVNPLTSKKTR